MAAETVAPYEPSDALRAAEARLLAAVLGYRARMSGDIHSLRVAHAELLEAVRALSAERKNEQRRIVRNAPAAQLPRLARIMPNPAARRLARALIANQHR